MSCPSCPPSGYCDTCGTIVGDCRRDTAERDRSMSVAEIIEVTRPLVTKERKP